MFQNITVICRDVETLHEAKTVIYNDIYFAKKHIYKKNRTINLFIHSMHLLSLKKVDECNLLLL